MEKQKIGFELKVYDSQEALPKEDQALMKVAIRAREDAYAPYSKFKVGAAVLLANNKTVIGSNQENASYPSGLCAERVAIFQAGALYPNVPVKALAVCASSTIVNPTKPAAPCGNCRQSLSEYEQRQKSPIRILMMGNTGTVYQCDSVADILPLAFGNSYLF